MSAGRPRPTSSRKSASAAITLTTDFGLSDPFVGIMKGVIAQRAPSTTVIDVSHGIAPQDVMAGALVLRAAESYFPAGTVHVVVVDPGVGSARGALCLQTERALFVGPDNGVLTLAAPAARVRGAFAITNETFCLHPRSATFHGRDVFAPVAAALATGTPPTALGPRLDNFTELSLPEPAAGVGEIIYIDHFGNLVTNLPPPTNRSATLRIADDITIDLVTSYAAGAPGSLIAVVNSWNLIEIAVRNGSARDRLHARVGDAVRLLP